MSPCPLCWLRTHGFPQIPEDHGKEWWVWLAENQNYPPVKTALEAMPSGVLDEE